MNNNNNINNNNNDKSIMICIIIINNISYTKKYIQALSDYELRKLKPLKYMNLKMDKDHP